MVNQLLSRAPRCYFFSTPPPRPRSLSGEGRQRGDFAISIIGRGDRLAARDRLFRLILLLLWTALSVYFTLGHVVWRDEMRALSLALTGDSVTAMLRAIHGEGHPALWYLMLRGAHAVFPVREVLPVVGWLGAFAAACLFAWRAPFRPLVLALILFGAFFAFEYAAIARNYAIGMLGLFAVAALYKSRRDRGVTIGVLLALLCNTNVPCCVLAAAILGFWLVELLGEEGLRWGPKYRLFLLNAAVAAAGAALCFATVFPTVHDAAVIDHPGGVGPVAVLKALATPALSFWDLVPPFVPNSSVGAALFGILMFGSLLGLARAPAAFLSALGAMLAFELFFQLVYPGYYRHQALYLCYLVAVYWLVAQGRGGRWPESWRIDARVGRAQEVGEALFVLLVALQVLTTMAMLSTVRAGYPYSRARDLAALLQRERLDKAIVLADPDMFIEPLPYYLPEAPLYQMRAQRFGTVVRFTKQVRRELNPDDYLAEGRRLHAATGKPVVFVIQHRLRTDRPTRTKEINFWYFSTTPEQVRRFQAAVPRIAAFAPVVSDETYEVYALR